MGARVSAPAPEGRWNPTAQRRAAEAAAGIRPVAPLCNWHTVPKRGSALVFGRASVAVARSSGPAGARWLLRIEGFEWKVTEDMPTARFRTLGGALSIPYTPVKAFRTLKAAQAEAQAIIAAAATPTTNEGPTP